MKGSGKQEACLVESLEAVEQVLLLMASRIRWQTRLVLLGGLLVGGLQLGVLWTQIDLARRQESAEATQRASLTEVQAVKQVTLKTSQHLETQSAIPVEGVPFLLARPESPVAHTRATRVKPVPKTEQGAPIQAPPVSAEAAGPMGPVSASPE